MHKLLVVGTYSRPKCFLWVIDFNKLVINSGLSFLDRTHFDGFFLHKSLGSCLCFRRGANPLKFNIKESENRKDLDPGTVSQRVQLLIHNLGLREHVAT